MNAEQLFESLSIDGIDLKVNADGQLSAPLGRLTDEQRSAINTHRAEVNEQILSVRGLTDVLMAAAMRVCDLRSEGESARNEMRQVVLSWPPLKRAELLDYFNKQYPASA